MWSRAIVKARIARLALLGGSAFVVVAFLVLSLAGGVGRSPLARAQAQADGPAMILYSEEDFAGRSLLVTDALLDLPKETADDGTEFDWNDNVRSIRVLSGTWRLYQHGRLNTQLDDAALSDLDVSRKARAAGWGCLVSAAPGEPVEQRSAAGWGWVPEISSIELVSAEPLPDWAREPLPGS